MVKRYKAKSSVHLSVMLPNGNSTRVSFISMSAGGSVYYTDDKDIQEGLENHHKFNKLFFVDESFVDEKMKDNEMEEDITPKEGGADNDVTEEDNEMGGRIVEVKDLTEAKDFLADKFGYSRSKLRSRVQIEEAGKEKGITFIGI